MLPINKRVKKDAFPEIMKKGRFLHGENLYIVSLDRKDALPSRFSFVVPAKVKKTSVGRHLIKRRLTAVVEKALTQIKPGFSAILYAKKDISAFSYQKTEKEILELLSTLGYTH
jgi:ribonuclease P protein component